MVLYIQYIDLLVAPFLVRNNKELMAPASHGLQTPSKRNPYFVEPVVFSVRRMSFVIDIFLLALGARMHKLANSLFHCNNINYHISSHFHAGIYAEMRE